MPHFIHDDDWPDFQKILAAWRSGRLTQPAPPPRAMPGGRPLIRAILLEDLESGGTAEAAVTTKEFRDEIQEITFIGTVTGGHFKLSFDGEATGEIAWNASAAALTAALEALPNINAGDLNVVKYPGRYLVRFTGQFAATDVPLLTVTENSLSGAYNSVRITSAFDWVDANRTESIHGQLPVGTPTPLKAGAVITAGHLPDAASYCIINVECRDLDLADDYGSYGD